MKVADAINIDDLRRLAKRRLPKIAFEDQRVRLLPHGAKWPLKLVFATDEPVSSDSCISPRQRGIGLA